MLTEGRFYAPVGCFRTDFRRPAPALHSPSLPFRRSLTDLLRRSPRLIAPLGPLALAFCLKKLVQPISPVPLSLPLPCPFIIGLVAKSPDFPPLILPRPCSILHWVILYIFNKQIFDISSTTCGI
jgi:hypothetical protein